MKKPDVNRRDFNKLTAAAFGGMVAGTTVGAMDVHAQDKKKAEKKDIHVCRGLNSCKGHDPSGKNACAGQGACATAAAHKCAGMNACKGQGGCGAHPGEHKCKGMGKCAVPLSDKAWKVARASFENRMKKAKKPVGAAPPKPKKKS